MQFTDAVTVAGTRRTEDGYLVATAKAVRTGIQLYAGREVGVTDKAVVRVYRPPEEVFADASLQSFSHAPVTNDHPAEAVTEDNWKELAVGEISTAAKKDGEWVHLPLILKDAKAIKAVEDGKRELSAGYTCDLDLTPGVTADGVAYDGIQKNIKINHLALVDRARAGPQARIGDGAYSWGAAPIHDETPNQEQGMTLQKVTVDGITVEMSDTAAQVVSKVIQQLDTANATIKTMQGDHQTAIEAKDGEIGTLKADLKKAQDAAIKPADLDKMVADRATLVATVKVIDAKIVVDGKSDADLRKAAVAAKLGDDMVKDASDAEIAGMFRAIAKDAKPADPFAAAMKDGVKPGEGATTVADAYNQMLERDRNAWQNPQEAK